MLSRAKQLHWTWTACNELAVAAINGWPHLLARLQREWCSLFLRAAEAARTMQRRCLPAGSQSADMILLIPLHQPSRLSAIVVASLLRRRASTPGTFSWLLMTRPKDCMCCIAEDNPSAISAVEQYIAPLPPAGVWGTRTALLPAANDGGDGVSEQQLQAQAWVPSVLAALLRQAERSIGCIINDVDGALLCLLQILMTNSHSIQPVLQLCIEVFSSITAGNHMPIT